MASRKFLLTVGCMLYFAAISQPALVLACLGVYVGGNVGQKFLERAD